MPDLIGVGAALGKFFDEPFRDITPSHDQLTAAMQRADISAGDPRKPGSTVGKTRRIREVLVWATDHAPDRGLRFVEHVITLLRAGGRFSPADDNPTPTPVIDRLREALLPLGYALGADGSLAPTVIDNLAGTTLTDALQAYVNRVNVNPDDAALLVGESKDFTEAAARHLLVQKMGDYPTDRRRGNFPVTLASAFTLVGLQPAPSDWKADPDPLVAVRQTLYQLAISVNRLRNAQGSGHGRPAPSTTPLADGRVTARAMALITGYMLDALNEAP